MDHCIFCKIVKGEIPAEKIYEDEEVIVVPDLYPKAPVHSLVIPKKHISTINELSEADEKLVGHMLRIASRVAQDVHHLPGYKTIFNVEKEGGQEIMHIHLHLLGGAALSMPNVIQDPHA